MNKKSLIIAGVFLVQIPSILSSQTLPQVKKDLGKASVVVVGDTLITSTGNIERKWVLNGQGLRTVSLRDVSTNKEWCKPEQELKSDWDLPGAIGNGTKAEFVSLDVRKANDDQFINDYLEVITQFRYDSARLELQHVVWVFPDAPGIRRRGVIQLGGLSFGPPQQKHSYPFPQGSNQRRRHYETVLLRPLPVRPLPGNHVCFCCGGGLSAQYAHS